MVSASSPPSSTPSGLCAFALGNRGAHLLERDSGRGDRAGIDPHAHRRLLGAAHRHVGDARHLRDALRHHGVGRVIDRARRHGLRGQRQDQHRRRGRVGFAERRDRRQVARQVGERGVDRGLHVARRAVDLAVEVELHRDAGRAERRHRGDLGHARDGAEIALERRRDRRRHDGGIGARPARRHADGRQLHVRHAGDRQEAIRHDPDQHQPDRQQRSCRPAA